MNCSDSWAHICLAPVLIIFCYPRLIQIIICSPWLLKFKISFVLFPCMDQKATWFIACPHLSLGSVLTFSVWLHLKTGNQESERGATCFSLILRCCIMICRSVYTCVHTCECIWVCVIKKKKKQPMTWWKNIKWRGRKEHSKRGKRRGSGREWIRTKFLPNHPNEISYLVY